VPAPSAPPATLRAGLVGPPVRVRAPSPAVPELPQLPRYTAGDVLAKRYQLVELIDEGSMGAVWRARNLCLGLDVAVKLVRRDGHVPHAAARLLREAQATARVAHRAAVRIFDLSCTDTGEPFVVMELLNGMSLARALLESGPMSPIAAVQLLLPVVGALVAAHGAGIVHRDVKPGNIVLVREGRRCSPKLIDFGIAFTSSQVEEESAQAALVGSPAYMAPEQVRGGQEPDARADVWSVCVVLYEIVSGARPFGGPSSISIVHDVLRVAPPRPGAFAAHPRLWDIVACGLAKAPEQRWPTMAALGRALAEWAAVAGVAHDVAGTSLADYWFPPS
jgi:eukaryotic-like serine/threonine-protein kinase